MGWLNIDFNTLFSTGIVVSAITFLAKSLIGMMLSRDVETFKSDLRRETEVEIERFKANIQLANQIHLIEFSTLSAKRADLLHQLHNKLNAVDIALSDLSRSFQKQIKGSAKAPASQPHIPDGPTAVAAAQGAFECLHTMIDQEKIWFSDETESQLRNVLVKWDSIITLYNKAISDPDPSQRDDAAKAFQDAKSSASVALLLVRQEFRKLLGVVN